MLVEQLSAVSPVEALHVGVLVGLSGLDVLDRHAGGLGPGGEGLAEKLRAVVRA